MTLLDLYWKEQPTLVPSGLDDVFRIKEDWPFYLVRHGIRYRIVVPKDWLTDGPSIPWPICKIIPRNNQTWPVAIPHDLMYAERGMFHFGDEGEAFAMDRAEVDTLFCLGLMKQEITGKRATTALTGLRWFGGKAWKDRSLTDIRNQGFTIPVEKR